MSPGAVQEIESCLASALLLAIHGFGEVRQFPRKPMASARQRGMNQFVNQVDAASFESSAAIDAINNVPLSMERNRIGKIGDGNRRAWLTEPVLTNFMAGSSALK